jgi:hypothetical protein
VAQRPIQFPSKRGGIHDLSKRARIRCAWALANAPEDWGAMATLTFRTQPQEPKQALRRFVRSFRMNFGKHVQWAWVMEWQTRGVVHFHLFFSAPFVDSFDHRQERVIRHGAETLILRGFLDDWIVRKWIACVDDDHEDFIAFQKGGILEKLRTPDAASRYVAKEAGKRAQKQLPDGVSAAGRWWWISPAGKPQPIGFMMLKKWPFDKCYKLVFDLSEIRRRRCRDGERLGSQLTILRSSRMESIEANPV